MNATLEEVTLPSANDDIFVGMIIPIYCIEPVDKYVSNAPETNAISVSVNT